MDRQELLIGRGRRAAGKVAALSTIPAGDRHDQLRGRIPILATPFRDDESLDLDSWDRLVEFMAGLGVDGITILGVLGESNRLSDHERATLIERAVATVKRRIPIIVGTSHSGTRATEHLSEMAQQLGADAVMVTPLKEPVPNDDRSSRPFSGWAPGCRFRSCCRITPHPARCTCRRASSRSSLSRCRRSRA